MLFHVMQSCYSKPCNQAIPWYAIMLFHDRQSSYSMLYSHAILCYINSCYTQAKRLWYSKLHVQTYVMLRLMLHAKYSCNMPLFLCSVPRYSLHAMQHMQIHKIIHALYVYLYDINYTCNIHTYNVNLSHKCIGFINGCGMEGTKYSEISLII